MPNYISLKDAVKVVSNAERILVVGCSGGGKTTLALNLAEKFDLEYQSIDRDVRWLPNWQIRDRREQLEILSGLVLRNRWVMDGSNPSTFDIRVPRTDLIVWVRMPRRVALFSLLRRVLSNYGKVRIAMAKGCPEPIPDWDFLSYIWNFERDSAPRFIEKIDKHGPQVPILLIKSRSDGAQLLELKPTLKRRP